MLSRTTRILLVVAVLAVAAYLWLERNRDDDTGDAPEPLASFELDQVDGVIVRREHETLRFAREDSLWRMTAPVVDRAERDAVVPLLDALKNAAVARNLGAAGDRAPFGLDSGVEITLLAGADTLLDTTIGKRTVDEAWCYATRAHSNDLLLVPTDIARAATLPVGAYRNQRVVDFRLKDIDDYRVVTPAFTTGWTRRDDRWFTIVNGDTVAGDSVAVEFVLRRMRGLRIAEFLDADPPLHNVPLAGTVEVSGTAVRFDLAFHRATNGAWIATGSERSAVVVQGDISDLFTHTTDMIRERRLLQFSPPDAARIDVALPNIEGSIVRRGGVWAYPNPALGRVDPERAADFVRAMRTLKWTQAPAKSAPPQLAGARFSVTVTGESGTILDEMRADPRDDGLWYVTSRSSRGVWMIERTELDALAELFAQLKAR